MASLADISRRAGTSVATASRVLNGSTHPVSDATRARVMEAAADLGYQPSALARALVTRSSRIIGVIVNDIVDPYFAEIARGVEDVAGRTGHLVMVCNADHRVEAEIEYVRALRDYHAAGPRLRRLAAPPATTRTPSSRSTSRRRGPAAGGSSASRSATSPALRLGVDNVGRRARRHRAPDRARPPPDRGRRGPARALHERRPAGRLPRRHGRRRARRRPASSPAASTSRPAWPRRAACSTRARSPTPSSPPTTRRRSASSPASARRAPTSPATSRWRGSTTRGRPASSTSRR